MTENQIKNFWAKVKTNEPNACWEWTGAKLNGHGRIKYGIVNLNYKVQLVHRVSYQIHFGKIPEGMCVLHKCDNPPCVNPGHLWLGTNMDNIKDKVRKGRAYRAGGEENPSAKLKLKDVFKIRKLYKTGVFRQKDLGRAFDVSQTNIFRIINKKIWVYN